MKESNMTQNRIWQLHAVPGVPEIMALQDVAAEAGKYQLCFTKDENCTLEKIIFTLDEDTGLAARILVKILLRLRIAPEAALETAKKFYRMTKEFPKGNYSANSSSNA